MDLTAKARLRFGEGRKAGIERAEGAKKTGPRLSSG
jgi:hypothetical protein